MAALDNNSSAISYSMQEPSLRSMAPPSLFRAGSIQPQFSQYAAQRQNEIKGAFFNQAWMQEQRRAMLTNFEVRRQNLPPENRRLERVLER